MRRQDCYAYARRASESSRSSISERSESEESSSESEDEQVDYVSTSLCSNPNLTLADITLEKLSRKQMQQREEQAKARCSWVSRVPKTVDPRKELKWANRNGPVHTLVSYERIKELTEYAVGMHLHHLKEANHKQPQESAQEVLQRGRLAERIVHDHLRNALPANENEHKQQGFDLLARPKKPSNRQKRQTKSEELLFQEFQYLKQQCNLPLTQVAKRLKISYSRLLRLQKANVQDPTEFSRKRKPKPSFVKLHDRAKERILQLFEESKGPIQIPDIQRDIKKTVQLRLSQSMINRYLKERLNVSYRKLRPISVNYNSVASKLQRQHAASHFISRMQAQQKIINIDESVITLTEVRKRGWLAKGIRNQATLPRRPNLLNIIAGISNHGDLFYTINKGKNNSDTFVLFVVKLAEHLDSVNRNWRSNTVIMVDNAGYHRSAEVQRRFEELKVPLMYLGPYHFRMAPIEIFFSYMKSHDLNPLASKLTSRQQVEAYLKELAMHISRMERDWIPGSFIHVLAAALDDLALTNL